MREYITEQDINNIMRLIDEPDNVMKIFEFDDDAYNKRTNNRNSVIRDMNYMISNKVEQFRIKSYNTCISNEDMDYLAEKNGLYYTYDMNSDEYCFIKK